MNHSNWRHLQQKHRDKHDEAKPDKKQRKLDCGPSTLGLKTYFTQDAFDELLYEMFVRLNLPFNIIESPIFKRPFMLLKEQVSIMSASTLKRRLMDLYQQKKNERKLMLEENDSRFSFTTDCWTSPNNLGFLGITVHWVDKQFELQSMTLAFAPLKTSHCGTELARGFKAVLRDFGLLWKIMAITLDNLRC